jgi:acylphosphatase
MDDLLRLEAVVRGRVQGVGFRYHVVREARRLGLGGWVANEHDGSVRAIAEGTSAALDRLEELLRTGPPGSIISGVSVVRMPATGRFEGFAVRPAGHSGD